MPGTLIGEDPLMSETVLCVRCRDSQASLLVRAERLCRYVGMLTFSNQSILLNHEPGTVSGNMYLPKS